MKSQPLVSVTADELVIRIPWNALELREVGVQQPKRRLTAQDVLELVEAGRLAHRLGKTRSVRSLKELLF
ncbi:MAG: hypothetical protein Q8R91_01405 [Candidatus Omnitrophota bacterium]|nr:hypothetical protein [Candidatus Omnitrophota bacterium]